MMGLHLLWLFCVKIVENILSTAKTICLQKNRCLLSGILLSISCFISYTITKQVVLSDDIAAILAVSLASGIGCSSAMAFNDRFSKERTYVNVVMSDHVEWMQDFRDYLARQHITNVATDSYARGWDKKTITITAYAQTKAQSRQIDEYIRMSPQKVKRMIQVM